MMKILKNNTIWESFIDRLQKVSDLHTITLDEETGINYVEGSLKRSNHKSAKIHES